ncbi:MAG: cellulase family glycosylhydrolase [Clostridia bacterium]|nr:cellulase family glycosylhydrolase [Clostridia bacterium]
MKAFPGYTRGMGIGGWLTNYKRLNLIPAEKHMDVTIGDFEHFASYITRRDVEYIASLGVDHVRLGFDQLALEEFDRPGAYRDEVFAHIERFLGWAADAGLNVILNLHKCFGNYCDIYNMSKKLLDSPEYMDRFVALWLEIERRFHHKGREICFELLNELLGSRDAEWNALWHRTVAEIRRLNPDRLIMIGGSNYNSVNGLAKLEVIGDPNVVYTFHYYEADFTHQRLVLNRSHGYYNREMPYPCDDIERYRDAARTMRGDDSCYDGFDRIDKTFLRHRLHPALDFMAAHPDAILTCSEFGSIRSARTEWRENYFGDIIEFFDENGIPFTIWNYLSTPYDGTRYSLVDDDNRVMVSQKIADMLRVRP